MSLRNATLRLKDNKEYGRSPEKREAFRGSFFVGRMFVKTIERSEKKSCHVYAYMTASKELREQDLNL